VKSTLNKPIKRIVVERIVVNVFYEVEMIRNQINDIHKDALIEWMRSYSHFSFVSKALCQIHFSNQLIYTI